MYVFQLQIPKDKVAIKYAVVGQPCMLYMVDSVFIMLIWLVVLIALIISCTDNLRIHMHCI